jgi:hypothetical protein
MNYHLYPINFRKYSLILIYIFFCTAVIIWGMEFYFERLYGDLTRIGHFAERDFGWRTTQPAISSELFKDYALVDADVVVIGDSFSVSRTWQTRLIADGLKVSTIEWKDLKTDEALPKDLATVLRNSGFKGRYVIIESIERIFQTRMAALSEKSYLINKQAFVFNSAFPLYPFTNRERFTLHKLNGGDWGIRTLYNSIKIALNLPDKYLKSGAVQPVKQDACQLFSHRLCQYMLFVDGDFKKETFNSIANVLVINKDMQAHGIQPIWLIVPDKATVYLGYGKLNNHPYQNIWHIFAQYPELIAPDLASAFIQQSRIIKDFYMPNDTHLSANGFLYLGEMMINEMRKIKDNQAKQ